MIQKCLDGGPWCIIKCSLFQNNAPFALSSYTLLRWHHRCIFNVNKYRLIIYIKATNKWDSTRHWHYLLSITHPIPCPTLAISAPWHWVIRDRMSDFFPSGLLSWNSIELICIFSSRHTSQPRSYAHAGSALRMEMMKKRRPWYMQVGQTER